MRSSAAFPGKANQIQGFEVRQLLDDSAQGAKRYASDAWISLVVWHNGEDLDEVEVGSDRLELFAIFL